MEQEAEVKQIMGELKKSLNYIDKTNWFFEKDTVDFTSYIPFEQEQTSIMRPQSVYAYKK